MIRLAPSSLAATLLVAVVPSGCTGPARSAGGATPTIIEIQARKFAFSPAVIHLKKDVRAKLILLSLDRVHGLSVPGLGIRADIIPGRPATIEITPKAAGVFEFECDVFCGEGHEGMTGELVIDP